MSERSHRQKAVTAEMHFLDSAPPAAPLEVIRRGGPAVVDGKS